MLAEALSEGLNFGFVFGVPNCTDYGIASVLQKEQGYEGSYVT
jgi:hypothetical protein